MRRRRLGALRTHLAGDGGAAKAPAAAVLSAADHEFFAEQGYCVVKSAVPTHVCEAVKREAWECLAKHHGGDRDDDSTWSAPFHPAAAAVRWGLFPGAGGLSAVLSIRAWR